MKKIISLLMLLLGFSILLAAEDAGKILLQKAKNRLNQVNDYTANIVIKIDVNFLKVKNTRAKIYFKKPDKIKLESRGFAMLPRANFNFSALSLLSKDYLSVYVKSDTAQGFPSEVIKLIPTEENSDLILATLWIDKKREVINKIEATSKSNGSIRIVFGYGSALKYGLPDSAKFFFNIEKTRFGHFPAPDGQDNKSSKKKRKGPMVGHVTIFYHDYKINSGLKDSVFEEESTEELD